VEDDPVLFEYIKEGNSVDSPEIMRLTPSSGVENGLFQNHQVLVIFVVVREDLCIQFLQPGMGVIQFADEDHFLS
jgi:hypothetical protein